MKGPIFKVVATAMLWMLCHVVHAGTVTYVYTDPQGTPLAEADASGNITARFDYAPYGTAVASMSPAPNGPGYTGHVNDPDTGLVYMQARYYDPSMGRFLNMDPVALGAGNPFNFNRYSYANNNPIVNVDPDGKTTDSSNPTGPSIEAWEQMKEEMARQAKEAAEAAEAAARKTAPWLPGGNLALCITDGCSKGQWGMAIITAIPGDGEVAPILNEAETLSAGAGKEVISTGRTVANSLKEKLAMEEVVSKPLGRTPPRMPAMSDTKNGLMAADGWVKRTQNVNGVEIHYVENIHTGQVIDFKFIN